MSARAKLLGVLRAGATSCTCMAAGDLLCQRLENARKQDWKFDLERTARFGLIGVSLHGPFFHFGFPFLDRLYGCRNDTKTVAKKVATGQVSLFPIYLSSFFLYMSLLEGKGLQGGLDKLQASFVPTALTGTLFWPIANAINFKFIPSTSPGKRLLYVNAAGILWNSFLSWQNNRDIEDIEAKNAWGPGSTLQEAAAKSKQM